MLGIKKEKLDTYWQFIINVLTSFRDHHCAGWSAALAYYGIFAIFPLILFVIYIGRQFLQTSEARQLLNTTMATTVPFAMDDINAIIDQTLNSGSSFGVIGVIGLVWSGSAVFNVLVAALNEIWDAKPHRYWQRRVKAPLSVLILGIVFLGSFLVLPILNWFQTSLSLPNSSIYNPLFEFIIGISTIYLLFTVFPNRAVNKSAAFYSALAGTFLIELAKYGFMAYLGTVIERYGSIYGSIAWIVALGLWVYLVGVLFFLSAEFGAELERR